MAIVDQFDSPGRQRDAAPGSSFYSVWHDLIDALIDDRVPLSGPGNSVDPARVDLDVRERHTFTWTGFPRPLLIAHRDNRAAAFEAADADRLNNQPEYLEWYVTRTNDKIKSVVFTCETNEYYETLAQTDPDKLLRLYRRFVSASVQPGDWLDGASYNKENQWNTTEGILHYIMEINEMQDLLGVQQEQPTVDAFDGYDPLPYRRPTAADGRMNWDSWAITRSGLSVATQNAPGIYMIDWDDTGFARPDGTPVGDYWTVERGMPGAALRLRYEVPEADGFLVSDISIGGRPITTGGHIAEHIVVSSSIVAGAER